MKKKVFVTQAPGGIWMRVEEEGATWAMVMFLMSTSLFNFDLAGDAHDVYFGGASNLGLISTSKLLKKGLFKFSIFSGME